MEPFSGMGIVRGGSELEPIYIVSIDGASTQNMASFVETMTKSARIDADELYAWIEIIEEEAIIITEGRGCSHILSAIDAKEEIDEVYEYLGLSSE